MRKFLIGGLVLVAALASLAFAVLRNDALLLDALAARRPDTTLAAHREIIAPHLKLEASPEGVAPDAPAPVVVMFHGCSGYRPDFMHQWAEDIAAAGWRAISVDSHTPRGIDRETARARVCTGKQLLGQERAGDVLAALALVAARPDVDPTRMVVAGWSHGGWTVMDVFAMDLSARSPATISDHELSLPPLAGAILVYPYCGRGSWSSFHDWTIAPPALALIAGSDTVVNGPECQRTFETLRERGHDITLVTYPDADHVFDDPSLPDYFNAEANADARQRVRAFLSALR